jgi:3-hydroxybutyrate dehydrogenase
MPNAWALDKLNKSFEVETGADFTLADHQERFMLRRKVAVVTRSTCGTGLGIACKLAAAGADLGINGVDDATAAEILRQEISDTYGVRVAFSSADVSESYGATRLISDVTNVLGRVDVLVNYSGTHLDAAVHEFPVEQWHSTISNNLTAVFLTTRAVLPQMFERNWGRIINVASVSGLVATANRAAYVASTHAVVGLTKCVALEIAPTGITCNAICPSPLSASRPRKQTSTFVASGHPDLVEAGAVLLDTKYPALALPGNWLGDLATFLCSEAAAHLNGVALPVDGGGSLDGYGFCGRL